MTVTERRLNANAVSIALAGAGVALAGYLTLVHYRGNLLVCGISNCHTVQSSKYAELQGVPVALLGLAMYVALLGLSLARSVWPGLTQRLTIASFAIAFAGFLFSAYLTAIELWVIDAICQWCVVSALLVTMIAVVEGARVWRILGAAALQ